jgi:hypothetical protein
MSISVQILFILSLTVAVGGSDESGGNAEHCWTDVFVNDGLMGVVSADAVDVPQIEV